MVLLLLVLGSAAADKTSSDTWQTFRDLSRSDMDIPLSRPRLVKIATLLDKIARFNRGRKNVLFVNYLEARKMNKLVMRYLREKARKGYIRERETAVTRPGPFRKFINLFLRYVHEYKTSAIIEQAVIQSLERNGNHPTKN